MIGEHKVNIVPIIFHFMQHILPWSHPGKDFLREMVINPPRKNLSLLELLRNKVVRTGVEALG